MSTRRRKHWGWGHEDQQPTLEQARAAAPTLSERLGIELGEPEQPVALELLQLRPPRIEIPSQLRDICTQDPHARAVHALGKSYVDIVRGFRGQFEHPPDLVARPRGEEDLERLLEWCSGGGIAAIPFGGGTSVVGGVTPDVGPGYNGALSIDMGAMDRLLEVDEVSLAASSRRARPARAWRPSWPSTI